MMELRRADGVPWSGLRRGLERARWTARETGPWQPPEEGRRNKGRDGTPGHRVQERSEAAVHARSHVCTVPSERSPRPRGLRQQWGAESCPQPPGHQEGWATGTASPGLGLHCVGQNLATRSSGPEGIRRN